MNFTLSQPISKNSSDVTETFRFNLGTTFNAFQKIFYFLFSTNSLSSENIAYIDIDFILNNSLEGKLIIKQLNELNDKNLNNLQNKKNLKMKKKRSITNRIFFQTTN